MASSKTPAKKRPGRPAIDPGQDSMPISIRLTAAQREKLDKLGGPQWVRERIDKAKMPTE